MHPYIFQHLFSTYPLISSHEFFSPGIGGGSTFVPPPVVDGSAEVFFAMKRQMDEMANELKTLRTKVMQTEVISSLESQREASHHPLTLVEKKALVKDVQKLISVPEHLNEVTPLGPLELYLPPRNKPYSSCVCTFYNTNNCTIPIASNEFLSLCILQQS